MKHSDPHMPGRRLICCLASFALAGLAGLSTGMARANDPWIVLEGGEGPGRGKHIVLVSGDEEYRSEEALPQLAKILSKHHGFKCTVLFAIDRNDGTINPDQRDNIPGLEALDDADLMVVFLRFRDLPDDQMKHIVEYVESGRPIVGLRTATHSFALNPASAYHHYDWQDADSSGGFGRRVLGETWINHHGAHGSQSTGGVIAPGAESHPILRGIKDRDVWGPTDVYEVRLPLPEGCQPLVLGQVLEGMRPEDKPIDGPKNDPLMPVAWTNTYVGAAGKPARVFTTTMGASQDLESEGMRRLLVNACYWGLEMDELIDADAPVELVGDFQPLPFKFGGYRTGVRPADLLPDGPTP
jgi:type 1 glutamine amidotransferase